MDFKQLLDEILQKGEQATREGLAEGKAMWSEASTRVTQSVESNETLKGALDSAKEGLQTGEDWAARQLGVGDDPESRANLRKGIGGGLAAGLALALLFGTKTGRSLGGTALTVGSLAALGGLAYKAYQRYADQSSTPTDPADVGRDDGTGLGVNDLTGDAANERASILLRAMIAAAKADGAIDDAERALILDELQNMGVQPDDVAVFSAELDMVPDPASVAALAETPQAAAEIYAASLTVIRAANPNERAYLDMLGRELGIAPELAAMIEAEVRNAAA